LEFGSVRAQRTERALAASRFVYEEADFEAFSVIDARNARRHI